MQYFKAKVLFFLGENRCRDMKCGMKQRVTLPIKMRIR